MRENNQITVTRRIAARFEIETAIELFLRHSDPVSAHVLAWAAVEVLRGVAKVGNMETLHGNFEDWIEPSFLNEWRRLQKEEFNFFKHADRDTDRVLDNFVPEITSSILMAACFDYRKIYNQSTWKMYIFSYWHLCRNPELIKEKFRNEMNDMRELFCNPDLLPFRESTNAALALLDEGGEHHLLHLEEWPNLLEP